MKFLQGSKREKRTIIGLIVSILALTMFTIGMTFAYFTATSSSTSSSMQFGTLEVVIENNSFGISNEVNGTHELVPGCTVFIDGVVNLGNSSIEAFVRLKPEVEITTWNGAQADEDAAVGTLQDLVFEAFERSGEWLRATDNNGTIDDYVYYNGRFIPENGTGTGIVSYDFGNIGGLTSADIEALNDAGKLANKTYFVVDASEFGNEWQGCEFTVSLVAEAIQAEHVNITLSTSEGSEQTNVNAIAGATATSSNVIAWTQIASESNEDPNEEPSGGNEQNTPTPEEESLQYLSFTEVNSDGSEKDNAETFNADSSDVIGLNEAKSSNSALMTDGTLFVSVESKSGANSATGDIAIPGYIKVVNGDVQVATQEEWEADNAYKVIKIGTSAFWNCSITSIVIPSTVTTIGFTAFQSCSLTSVIIPSSVTKIDTSAFSNCSSLISIEIPNSVSYIGNSCFEYCKKLVKIKNLSGINLSQKGLPSISQVPGQQIVTTEDGEFSNTLNTNDSGYVTYTVGAKKYLMGFSKGAEKMEVNDLSSLEITDIYQYAFYQCTSLISIEIPSNITSIGSYAFTGCSRLVHIKNFSSCTQNASSDAAGNETIGSEEEFENELNFNDNGYITYTVGDPEDEWNYAKYLMGFSVGKEKAVINDLSSLGITDIYDYTFYGCTDLTSVTLPSSVKGIGQYAFYRCTNLVSANIAGSYDLHIDQYAFNYCTSLSTLSIGNIKSDYGMYDMAFYGCTALSNINYSYQDDNNYYSYSNGTLTYYDAWNTTDVDNDSCISHSLIQEIVYAAKDYYDEDNNWLENGSFGPNMFSSYEYLARVVIYWNCTQAEWQEGWEGYYGDVTLTDEYLGFDGELIMNYND